ncbi:MAG TPA: hypothetical protein PKA20_09525 [Burkholderiaceae bacterium]|nr:hypothetical protein [Burkholderiaceae bacterium]
MNMGIPVGSIAALVPAVMLAVMAVSAQAQTSGQAPGSGQGQGATQAPAHGLGPVPGGCQSPDLSKLASDDERHAAVRVYLLCLNEQNRSSEAMAGSLSRPLPPGFDSREPMVRPYDPRSSGSHRYPDDRGRGSR